MTEDESNGILARVPGQIVSGGHRLMPEAGPDQPERTVDVVADHAGPVRLTYRAIRTGRGQRMRWFWVACHAEALPDASTCVPIPPDERPLQGNCFSKFFSRTPV